MKIDWCGPKPDDPKPILYFSGILGKKYAEKIIQERTGGMGFRCISYAYWKSESRVQWATQYLARKCKVRLFMDSGAFTLQKDPTCTWAQHDTYLEEYAAYLHKHKGVLDWYAPVDWRRRAAQVRGSIERMQKMGLYPVPVFHGNDPLVEFERWIGEGAKLICIAQPQKPEQKRMLSGDALRRFYQRIFNIAEKKRVYLHGFSQTGQMMFEFPWYSVDSTSWCVGSKNGEILDIDRERRRLTSIHIAEGDRRGGRDKFERKTIPRLVWRNLPEAIKVGYRAKFEALGFTEEGLRTEYMERICYNARVFIEATRAHNHNTTGSHAWRPVL